MEERVHSPSRWAAPTPYQAWQAGEGIPSYKGSYVANLYELELKPWARVGQMGAFVNLADQEEDDGYVLEITPSGNTEVMHHLFEATIYVLEGRGATSFWQTGSEGRKQTLEWQKGSLFSPPLNCYYQHFNLDGRKPARVFAVTNAPMMLNATRDPDLIFRDPFVVVSRYNSEENYFSDPGGLVDKQWRTNFVPNVRSFELGDNSHRGMGATAMHFVLANNQMQCHISEWPAGTYKKAHCHDVGAYVTILGGEGYTFLWFEGEERRRVDWKDGSVLCPQEAEYHQHFSTGRTPARFIALRLGALHAGPAKRVATFNPKWRSDHPEYIGGTPFEEEDPAVYDLYVEECAKNGVEVVLPRPRYAAEASVSAAPLMPRR